MEICSKYTLEQVVYLLIVSEHEKGFVKFMLRKIIIDDGFCNHLVENAALVGAPGIPMLVDMHNTGVPKDIVPFEKCRTEKNKRKYIHFYMHDKYFASVLKNPDKYIDIFKEYDGIITPDCSILIGQAPCLQQASTYFNRAIGVYYQHKGIPVIPNVRWGDESTYEYCFLGVPKNSIVSISTHGCVKDKNLRTIFKAGLGEMLKVIEPSDVLVHGYMPDSIFDEYYNKTNFHRYPSMYERMHGKEEVVWD